MAFVYVKGKEISTSELRAASEIAMPDAYEGRKFGKGFMHRHNRKRRDKHVD